LDFQNSSYQKIFSKLAQKSLIITNKNFKLAKNKIQKKQCLFQNYQKKPISLGITSEHQMTYVRIFKKQERTRGYIQQKQKIKI
jgi:hypothetical protein